MLCRRCPLVQVFHRFETDAEIYISSRAMTLNTLLEKKKEGAEASVSVRANLQEETSKVQKYIRKPPNELLCECPRQKPCTACITDRLRKWLISSMLPVIREG